MKQSRNSWNIKFMMMLFEDYPQSLCTLFWCQVWTFIWGIIALPFFIVGKIVSIFLSKDYKTNNYFNLSLGGFGASVVLILTFSGIYMFFDFTNENPFLQVGFAFWASLLVIGVFSLYSYIKDKKNSSESLIRKYIKAKKNKVCPIIEWED